MRSLYYCNQKFLAEIKFIWTKLSIVLIRKQSKQNCPLKLDQLFADLPFCQKAFEQTQL